MKLDPSAVQPSASAHARAPAAARTTSSVRVRVGTLALPGLSSAESLRFSAAFERELSALLVTNELPTTAREAEHVLVPRFLLRANESVEGTGRRLARVVAAQLREVDPHA